MIRSELARLLDELEMAHGARALAALFRLAMTGALAEGEVEKIEQARSLAYLAGSERTPA